MIMTSINAPGHTKKRLSVQIAAVIGTAFLPLSAFAADDSLRNDSSLETITVTGEKLDKSLKDTTAAVTVITEDEFENGEVNNVNELASSAPNVINGGFGSISIRGISETGAATGGYAFMTGARARVSTVIDGITQSWSGYSFTPSKLWDTQQVEVLKGPQSTVQGTNSIGGALVVTTNDPTYQYEASARAGLETYKNHNVKHNLALMVNAPIIDDEMAFRIAADGLKGEGYMNYDQDTNELDTGPDVDDSENYNVRAKLLWEPASMPKFSAKLTVTHHKYEGEYLNWANDVDTGYSTQTNTLSTTSRVNTRLQDSTVDSIATDLNYEISEGIDNVLTVSYLSTDVYFQQYPNAFPVTSKKDQLSLENRVTFQIPESDWSGVSGLYISRNKSLINVDDGKSYDGGGKVITSAIYGEGFYQLNDLLTFTSGARLENEKVDRNILYNAGYSTATDLDQDTSESIFLPKAGVIYNVTKDTTLTASVKRGYNAGGAALNWTTREYYTYDKETVIAYEAGIRSQLTENSELTADVFYNDYSGYQAFINSEYIENIDESHTYGIEVAGSVWATDNLKLTSSIGLLNSKVDSDDASSAGNELPNAPHSNLAAGFTQYIGQDLSFGVDVNYVGEYYSDLSNTEEYKAGDYVTANAQLQYIIGDFTIDGYVTNLTDEDVILYNNSNSRSSRAAVGQTRTFGFNVTYKM